MTDEAWCFHCNKELDDRDIFDYNDSDYCKKCHEFFEAQD